MNASERRVLILQALSDRRMDTVSNLAFEFSVSERTILRDIEELSCTAPLYTVQGNGGGIRVTDGWYVSTRYLHEDQEKLLRSILPGLEGKDKKTMEEILSAFAKPKVRQCAF